jgi:hypothetical protein
MCEASFVRRVFAFAFLLGLVMVSCRQIADIGDREAAPACGPLFVDARCGACSEASCCAELGACARDPACADASACLASCTDFACRSRCADDHRAGFARPLADVLACEAKKCIVECSLGSCGAVVTSSAGCSTCFDHDCCAPARSCGENASCLTRRFCRERCVDEPCRRFCDLQESAGAIADEGLRLCQRSKCAASCAAWACLAKPPARAPVFELTIFVRDSVASTTPVPNVRLRQCRRGNLTCDPVGDEVVTDNRGIARFRVSDAAFENHFELVDPSGKFLPELVYIAPPPRRDTVVLVQALTRLAREQLVVGLNLEDPAPSEGDLLMHASDCTRSEAAGVRLTLDSGSASATEFYLSRSVPIRAQATDDQYAFGGFLGLEEANYVASGLVPVNGAPTAAFTLPVLVRRGTITFIDFAAGR